MRHQSSLGWLLPDADGKWPLGLTRLHMLLLTCSRVKKRSRRLRRFQVINLEFCWLYERTRSTCLRYRFGLCYKPLRDCGWALILGHHRLLLHTHTHILFPRLPSILFMPLYRTLVDQDYSGRHTCLFNPLKYLQMCTGSVQIRALPASQHALNTGRISLSLSLWPVKTWRSAFSALEWRRTAPLDSDITFVFLLPLVNPQNSRYFYLPLWGLL